MALPVLGLHLVSVTLTKALRAYSRTRLVAVCARRGRPGRADEVDHNDARTERAAEVVAVLTGLMLAALLGMLVAVMRVSRPGPLIGADLAVESALLIPLALSALGYVTAGVVGRVFAERVIDRLWPFAGFLRLITGPVTLVFGWLEGLVERMAESNEDVPRPTSVELEIPADAMDPEDPEPDLPESTRELLQHALALTHRDVSELMTPRSRMVMIPSTATARAAAAVFHDTGRSRVPMFGENHDDVVGVLIAKDLYVQMIQAGGSDFDSVSPRKLVRPTYCVPETKNAYDLLEEFREHRTQIAIVLDEYGGVSGLISLEDLLEELVGDIDDEHDVPAVGESVIPLGGSRYEIDGSLTIEDLNDRLSLRLPTDEDFQTVGGLTLHAVGQVPEPGAVFRYNGIEFQVVEVAEHSIRRVRIDLQPAAAVGRS